MVMYSFGHRCCAISAARRSCCGLAQVARDNRHESARHAIGLRPRAPPELDDVAKTARGDHAGAREPPLEHGVGGGRGAVHDEIDAGRVDARFAKCSDDAESLIVRRGRHLGDADAAPFIDQDQVGEGAADIDAGDDAPASGFTALCSIFLNHARNPKRRI